MSLTLNYENEYGTVTLSGGGNAPFRITKITGLTVPEREYIVFTYAGIDGQETISSRAMPRSIVIAADLADENAVNQMRKALRVLSREGYLYINDGNVKRRIFCNQTVLTDNEIQKRHSISSFTVQFVCDNPFFEDKTDTSVSLYSRLKNIATPFTLPRAFTETATGALINVEGDKEVEPIIKVRCPDGLSDEETVQIINQSTGAFIKFSYTPATGDEITVNIKERTVVSTSAGNIINSLSADTFLSDFVLKEGVNSLSVSVGDIQSNFTVECIYNNLYIEAVIL